MNTTLGIVRYQIQVSAPCLVDCSWTQICLEGRILLRFGAVDKSTLPLKRLIELTPDALAQQIHVPHFKINTSSFKVIEESSG